MIPSRIIGKLTVPLAVGIFTSLIVSVLEKAVTYYMQSVAKFGTRLGIPTIILTWCSGGITVGVEGDG